jgi:uncharacterized protein (DUF488 family)
MERIYTIGYSPHTPASFVRLLAAHGIMVVADVRSNPYSKYRPQFNREDISTALAQAGIGYVFLGSQCGARPEDRSCYVDDVVSYERLATHPEFQKGMSRLREGMMRCKIALMCAEKDPISCHRMILVSRQLSQSSGTDVGHILEDGTCEQNSHAERRLLRLFDLGDEELPGFGRSFQQRLAEAYRRQAALIAYREREEEAEIAEARHG